MRYTRIRPGLYESESGHRIERQDAYAAINGGPADWFITWPGQTAPDAALPTLRDAKDAIENETDQEGTER